MRLFCYFLASAVVIAGSVATAQEKDKPQDTPRPWWYLSDDAAPKDQPRASDASQDSNPRPKPQPRLPLPGRPNDLVVPHEQPVPPPRGRAGDWAPPALQGPVGQARERLVYRLANAPALDVAKTLNDLLEAEQATPGPPKPKTIVLADVISNSLIISGTSDTIHETTKLIEQLDAEPLMVHVEAVVGLIESREGFSLLAPNPDGPELSCSHAEACELIEQFSKSDAVKILARPQVMTLDNQPAFVQIGHRVPRVVRAGQGQGVATELENVGLIVGITPRVTEDHTVIMEIDLEKSQLSDEEEGIPLGVDANGTVIRSPKIETIMVQTTVKVPSGRAVIIGGLAQQAGEGQGELVLVVTPHVVTPEE